MYGFLADAVVLFHFAFVLFAIGGALLVFRWKWLALLHLPCFLWAAGISFGGWICPLTPLENDLRAQAGAATYEVSFVDHYIMPILYPEGLTRPIQIGLGAFILLLNITLYALLIYRLRHRRCVQNTSL